MNKIFTMILAVAAAAGTSASSAQTKWDLPTGFLPTSYITENVQQFATDLDKATAGKLKITLHTNGSLYKLNEIKRAVQTGQVQIAEICLCTGGNENALYALDQVPFLTNSYADAYKLHLAAKSATEKLLAAQGIKMLFAVPWPPQGLFTMKPVASVADFRGTKIRAAHPAGARLAQLLQGQPISINLPELPQALSTGMVDVFPTAAVAALETKLHEQAKYFYDVKAWMPKNAVVVNLKAFTALDSRCRPRILQCVSRFLA